MLPAVTAVVPLLKVTVPPVNVTTEAEAPEVMDMTVARIVKNLFILDVSPITYHT